MFEHAGRTENEPLTEFELNKLELVVVDKDKDDDDANQQQQKEEGDEVLGVEFLFFASPDDYPNRVFLLILVSFFWLFVYPANPLAIQTTNEE